MQCCVNFFYIAKRFRYIIYEHAKSLQLCPTAYNQLFVTLWTVAQHAPQSMGSSRQEYWSGLPCPPPGSLPNPGLLHCRQILYHLSHQGSPTEPLKSESEVAQLCPTLCDPMDCSPPGSPVHGILQARILEWVAMPSSQWTITQP